MSTLNWLAVLVAAAIAFLLGGAWYRPALFGRAWIEAQGLTDEQLKALRRSAPRRYGLIAVLQLLMAYAVARLLVHWHVAGGVADGILVALLVWVGFVLTTGLISALLAGRRLTAFAIDAGYQLVCLLAMGIVLGIWR
jgi:hypothetical protein